jgi:hypothetical protein
VDFTSLQELQTLLPLEALTGIGAGYVLVSLLSMALPREWVVTMLFATLAADLKGVLVAWGRAHKKDPA